MNRDGDFADTVDQTRTLDRSLDTLGRSNGWQPIKAGSPDIIENRADYTFDAAGRLATVGPFSGR